MAPEAKSSAVKLKSSSIHCGDSSPKRPSADSRKKYVSIVNKTEVKSKTVSGSSKTKATTIRRIKKVFSLAGQKFDLPEEDDGTRFAVFRKVQDGIHEKKQRNQKMQRLGTPIKSSKPCAKPESSQKQQLIASMNSEIITSRDNIQSR